MTEAKLKQSNEKPSITALVFKIKPIFTRCFAISFSHKNL